jgi:hypothetical protein
VWSESNEADVVHAIKLKMIALWNLNCQPGWAATACLALDTAPLLV